MIQSPLNEWLHHTGTKLPTHEAGGILTVAHSNYDLPRADLHHRDQVVIEGGRGHVGFWFLNGLFGSLLAQWLVLIPWFLILQNHIYVYEYECM